MSNYTEVSVSGYNASPPPDDGSTGSDNEMTWAGIKTKLSDPIKTALDTTQSNITTAMDAAVARLPVGTVLDYAGLTAPSGFLLCYGQAVSRTTYSDLFAVVSTTYGTGDGSTTFNLPDLRGRVVAGQDDMGGSSANRLTNADDGLDGDTLGATGGGETQALVTGNLAAHTHDFGTLAGTGASNGAHTHFIANTDSDGAGATLDNTNYMIYNSTPAADRAYQLKGSTTTPTTGLTTSDGAHTHTVALNAGATGSAGSGTAFGVVQPTFILNKIIKY